MKKIVFIVLFVFLYCIGNSQNTTTQNLGAPRTLVINKGGFQSDSSLILPFFNDTASANLSPYVKTYRGNMIKVGDTVYIRNKTATKWIMMSNESTGNFVPYTGATQDVDLGNHSITLNTQDGYGFIQKDYDSVGIRTYVSQDDNVSQLEIINTNNSLSKTLYTNNGFRIYDGESPLYKSLTGGSVTGNRSIILPDASGTLALTSQVIDSLKRSTDSIFAHKNGSWRFQYRDSVGNGGSGTVTSVATGYGLTGGTITTTGTLIADTSVSGLSGKYVRISDTANKWVNSVTKLNDSTIRVIKGASTTDITLTPSATVTSATRLITTVYNKSGATIPKGSVVYIDGAHSSVLPSIALAQANQEGTSAYTYGLVETDISNNSSGIVIQSGNITNLNLPTSTYTDGQTLYLSPTVAGGYTTTKPTAPNHYVAIGTITRAHPTLGTIQIAIRNGFQLDEMSDVAIALIPADSTLLQFSRVDSLWHDVSPLTAIGNRYIKPSDTSAMLSKYLRKTDTVSLSNRIDAKGYGINFGATQSTFAANTLYYLGMSGAGIATNAAQRRVYIPASGTVKQVYLYTRTTNGTAGETWTMTFRLNNTSNTTIGSTATTSTDKVFSNANLNVSVVAGDYFEITTTTPATAPGISNIYGTLIIQ